MNDRTPDAPSPGASFAAERLQAYRRMFGEPVEVVTEGAPGAPSIDVHVYPPGFGERSFYTLITSGMSDRPMTTPPDLKKARRAELAMYVDQPGPSTVELLRTVARAPHQNDLWLGHGHTLPNGDPPAPLFPESVLSVALVLHTIVAPERHLDEHFLMDGDPLNVLWLLPISAGECQLKLTQGLSALLDRFNQAQLSFVLDPGRESVA